MHILRICLLVLIVALLPIRGAMAVAMLCAPSSAPPAAEQPADAGHASHASHAGHAGHADHAQAHGDAAAEASDHPGHDHGATSKCSTCTACCSTPPLASAIAGMAAQPPLATVFPEARAPAPTFQSDGQDRPPRTT